MEWPIFEMPFIGNRMLIALIATVHICISHGMAVGGSYFVVSLHYKSLREGNERLGELAFRILRVFFITTTSLGALTGVGIWLTTSIVSSPTIGSLLHVFFWAWFLEWLVFVTEVVTILIYYLSWNRMGPEKSLKIGILYVVVSWITMMLITGILGAMLTPGRWIETRSFFDGFFNPSYLPQLLTRTSLAALLSIAFGLIIVRISRDYRDQWENVWRFAGKSLIVIAPVFLFGVLNYYHTLPQQINHLVSTAMMTTGYAVYAHISKMYYIFLVLFLAASGAVLVKKRKDYLVLSFVPVILMVISVGQLERVREFIRKPFTIHQYLYSNGIRLDEAPFLSKHGILNYSGWADRRATENDPVLRNGEKIFKMECSICHTYRGVNGITKKTDILRDREIIENFLNTYRYSHPFMPPFVGTDEERSFLAAYLDNIVNGRNPQDMTELESEGEPEPEREGAEPDPEPEREPERETERTPGEVSG